MIDPHAILQSLSQRRPIFHSEADFQHEFAWELRSHHPDCQIRLEVPSTSDGIGTTDIVVRHGGAVCGVELKYLTRRYETEVLGEAFRLKAHGAQDLRRYDVLKDVWRLERFNRVYGGPSFVVALTNDRSYWRSFNRRATIDGAFRLDDGRAVSGELRWSDLAGARTIKGRSAILDLLGSYSLVWRDYGRNFEGGQPFRYLAIEVGRTTGFPVVTG